MTEKMNFPSEEGIKKGEAVASASDKHVVQVLESMFPGMATDDEVTIELGELGALLHSAFRAGAHL